MDKESDQASVSGTRASVKAKPKKRQPRDPKAPKLPLSSFMEFSILERPKIREEIGSQSIGEMGKILGQRWRNLSTEEKLPFEIKARENKMKYDQEKKVYEQDKADGNNDSAVSVADEVIVTSSSNCGEGSSTDETALSLDDIGFAKQKKYPWHPAFKVGVMSRGTRVKVQFFGTGQTSIVDAQNWICYSAQAESRIKSQELMKSVAFRNGLAELHTLRQRLMIDSASVTAPGIDFVPEVRARKFRKIDKDRLQKEEEENSRIFEQKMWYDKESNLWLCRDCDWQANVKHRAKCHARECGMRKVAKKRTHAKKFECSNANCDASFSLHKDLAKHYR